jgi:hypothetical protein
MTVVHHLNTSGVQVGVVLEAAASRGGKYDLIK